MSDDATPRNVFLAGASQLADIARAREGEGHGRFELAGIARAREGEGRGRFELLRQLHTRLGVDADRARSAQERAYYLQLRSGVFEMLQEQSRLAASRIVFRELAADRWLLGVEGAEREVPAASPIGARAGHRALRGTLPHCSEFTSSPHACSLVSRAVRRDAVHWAERNGCPALAAALRAVHLKAGRLVYLPASGAPAFLLD